MVQNNYYDLENTPPIKQVRYISDPYQTSITLTKNFVEDLTDPEKETSIDDIFTLKLNTAEDRILLIISELLARKNLEKENINFLKRELVQIGSWRLEIPFPQRYYKGRTWMDLNKMEMEIRREMRQEVNGFMKDSGFLLKELRDTIVEHRSEKRKIKIFDVKDLESMTKYNTW